MQKFLPKQADIDKILNVIQRKARKGTYLPVTVKEMYVRYLVSPFFKDLYLYLAQNKLPITKTAIQRVETLAERHILDSFLFKIVTTQEKEMALLVIPEVCIDKIIALNHSSLFCRTPRSHDNISYNKQYILCTKLNTLLILSYLPISSQ